MWSVDNKYVISGDPNTRELDVFHLVIAPTFACNLRCKHCYLPDHAARRMDWSVIATLLDDWAAIVERERGRWGGVFHVKGGEPTTMPYFEQILGRLEELKALRLMITTNGISLSAAAIDSMQRMREDMNESVIVTVSVDGGTSDAHEAIRGLGTFDKTWTTIRRLVDADVPVHVNCIITRSSKDSVADLLSESLDYGVTQVNLLPFVRQGFGQDISDEWLDPIERYEWLRSFYSTLSDDCQGLLYGSHMELLGRKDHALKECVAGYTGLFYVLPDGAVYSCPRLVHSDLLVGHLERQSVNDVFLGMRDGEFQMAIPRNRNGTIDCSCRGAVLEEVRAGNNRILEDEKAVRLRILDEVAHNGGAPMGACFSRNI